MHRKVIHVLDVSHFFLQLFPILLHELSVGWFPFLQFSEAARDVRPVREELLPPKPIKAARKRCALLQEAQRIDCVQNTTLAHPSSPDIL